MKFRLALFALITAVLAFGFFLMKETGAPLLPNALPAPEAVPVEEQLRDVIATPVLEETSNPAIARDEPSLAPKLELARGQLAWEAKIESVTAANDLSDTAKSRQLLAMIAALPEHAMTTATEEAVQRLADANYNTVALPVVTNPQTHGLVESVLFRDLMERPNSIMLPALLRIARIPNHPYAKFARENLDLLIGEDFGEDWLKWEAAVQKTLAAEK